MKLNSSQLEAFSTIAKTLNFTRAAEQLHVTQSALSQRIAKLEGDLEATLFVRDRNALRLTDGSASSTRRRRMSFSPSSRIPVTSWRGHCVWAGFPR